MSINFTVNGKATEVDAAPDTPLLWVLRDVLNLHGTKYGCGIGQCGACTVHVNGEPIAPVPCRRLEPPPMPQITTIEGLSANGTHPLQLAWLELDVPQCGYCQAGQIMSAAALLAKHPNPTNHGNQQRHDRQPVPLRHLSAIRQAIHKAAADMHRKESTHHASDSPLVPARRRRRRVADSSLALISSTRRRRGTTAARAAAA